ncbi:RNA polymerase II transcriptional coactivator [Phlebotomus argentipes]|uniref:RNA polymerase II transcriptional coactivator n=1 Tax=Phlebotomus argentipes TaxID=94469 RepID=UPI0028937023|nr:RNA polymerase II transcriptional coactivator [Phlebotomus argentipes]
MPKDKKASKKSSSSDSDSGPEDRNPPSKKAKLGEKEKQASSSNVTGADAEWQLEKMRWVSVSEFRGRKMVNIREYYERDGKILPGKKGIALSAEQWRKLCSVMNEVNEELK